MLYVTIADAFCSTERCYAMSWTLKPSQKGPEEEEQPSNLEPLRYELKMELHMLFAACQLISLQLDHVHLEKEHENEGCQRRL